MRRLRFDSSSIRRSSAPERNSGIFFGVLRFAVVRRRADVDVAWRFGGACFAAVRGLLRWGRGAFATLRLRFAGVARGDFFFGLCRLVRLGMTPPDVPVHGTASRVMRTRVLPSCFRMRSTAIWAMEGRILASSIERTHSVTCSVESSHDHCRGTCTVVGGFIVGPSTSGPIGNCSFARWFAFYPIRLFRSRAGIASWARLLGAKRRAGSTGLRGGGRTGVDPARAGNICHEHDEATIGCAGVPALCVEKSPPSDAILQVDSRGVIL